MSLWLILQFSETKSFGQTFLHPRKIPEKAFDSLISVTSNPEKYPPLKSGFIRVFVALSDVCMLSRYYSREIESLSNSFSGRDIQFFGVFPNPFSNDSVIRDFAKEENITFLLLRDAHGFFSKSIPFSVSPEAVVINREGEILYQGRIDDFYVAVGKHKGRKTRSFLSDAITEILEGRQIKAPFVPPVGCLIDRRLWESAGKKSTGK